MPDRIASSGAPGGPCNGPIGPAHDLQPKPFGEAWCDFWPGGDFIPNGGPSIGIAIGALHDVQFRPCGEACCDFWPGCSGASRPA